MYIVCNFHLQHSAEGIAKAQADFQRIIERAIEHGGHFYLTYHRWASAKQLTMCYPNIHEFVQWKKQYDPNEIFSK